jgi:tRNA(fMet)-specific endonuclease VapC
VACPPGPPLAPRRNYERPFVSHILVDTDVVSYLLNRHSLAATYEKILVGSTPMVSFMTIAGMDRGAMKRTWSAKRYTELREHLRQFVVVPYNEQICIVYAQICTELERKGRSIPTADALIAASARSLGIPILTNNKRHFERVERLDVI